MGPLSYLIAFVCIGLGAYYWFTNQSTSDSKSAASTTTRTTTKSTNFLDFDEDCTIRALVPSDLESVKVLVKSSGGCGYFKDHALTAYLDKSDEKHLGFGVEHKSSSKIICTQFICMVDDNETGVVLGAMFDPKYKSSIRVCYMRLSNDIQDKLSSKFEDLGKHRTLIVEGGADDGGYCNNAVLDWRIKFNLDSMTDDNVYYLYNAGNSEDDDSEDGVKVNGDFKESEDVEVATSLLSAFGVENVVMDWMMFQTKCLKEVLAEGFKAKTMGILVNKEKSALVLVYGGSDYYVYGKTPEDVLSAIRFALSQNGDAELGVFVSKAMVGDNAEIRKMFGKAMEREIVGLDYDMHIDGH